jgi:hypothetical protein
MSVSRKQRRNFPQDFKLAALRRMTETSNIVARAGVEEVYNRQPLLSAPDCLPPAAFETAQSPTRVGD